MLIEAGRFDRHLRKMRAEYAARRETLVQQLILGFGNTSHNAIRAGVAVLGEILDQRG